jgi:L-amino acid N-acyltransferase YncA
MSTGMADHVTIRPATDDDLPAVAAIYNHEIANSIATFDLEPPTLTYWHERLASDHPGDHLLVAVDGDGHVLGYAYSWSYRPRPAYNSTRETSVYLDPRARGQGIGKLLYRALFKAMADSGVHTAVALVALPNPGSIALHESVGFEYVGTMREVGYKFNKHIDTAWYQKMLDAGSHEPTGPAAHAVDDLAQRLGVDRRAVTVVRDEEVTWPDGSIGCPQPGMSYTQALVEGRLIILEAGGENYEYHAGRSGKPFLCDKPTPPFPRT